MSYLIRDAHQGDCAAMVRMGLDLWRLNRSHTPVFDNDDAVMSARQEYLEQAFEKRDEHHRFWLVTDQEKDEPQGYGYAQLFSPPPYEDNGTDLVGLIDEVYLEPMLRGQTIGEQLVLHMIASLKSASAQHIRLHSYAWNDRANHLYQRLGFHIYAQSWELPRHPDGSE